MRMQLTDMLNLALPPVASNMLVQLEISHIHLMEICSYILYPAPADDARRAALLSVLWGELAKNAYSEITLKVQTSGNIAVDRAIRTIIREIAIENLAVGHLPYTNEIKKAVANAHLAAEVLAVIRAISETGAKGSLNKAVFVLERVGIASRTRLFDSWRSHKSVAHIKLAICVVHQMNIPALRERVNAIIGIAREIQNFATLHAHILTSDIWEVPARGPVYEMDHFRLDDPAAAALNEYRAPQ